jgi:hypothetical protein
MNPSVSLKLIFSDSVQFVTENMRQIATLCLPFLLIGAIVNNVVLSPAASKTGSDTVFLYSVGVNLALHPIYTAALILMMARRAMRQKAATVELIASALGKYVPFLLLTLVQMGLMWFGFLLFVLPGVWAAARLAFADFYLVIENLDPREAIVKSFRSTRRYFFPVLASLALFALPVFMLSLLVGNYLNAVGANAVLRIMADTALSFVALFMHVILFRIFMQASQDNQNPAPVA